MINQVYHKRGSLYGRNTVFGKFEQYGIQCVQNPDYIIKDGKNENTVFMIMKLPNTNLNVVSRLALETDKNGLKNSVMTFYRIRERNLKKLMDKNARVKFL